MSKQGDLENYEIHWRDYFDNNMFFEVAKVLVIMRGLIGHKHTLGYTIQNNHVIGRYNYVLCSLTKRRRNRIRYLGKKHIKDVFNVVELAQKSTISLFKET